MQIFTTTSAQETQILAQKLAKKYSPGAIIALEGPLGAGKTTFAQGFAQGLGINDRLLSPTFVLMREYSIPGQKNGKLYHIDLYRLENIEEIKSLGLTEIFANPHNIVLIEWAEKLGENLPKKAVVIKSTPISENERKITITELPEEKS